MSMKTNPIFWFNPTPKRFQRKHWKKSDKSECSVAKKKPNSPPCRIEIVLGAKGRLYVILPTGVRTQLPFACNAPFIQDPSRLKIKDPETSPTNRWLLDRIGRLAASTMLRWLEQSDMPTVERAPAYGLFPDVDRNDASLEGVCGTTVEEAFEHEIQGQPMLLTESGNLTHENGSVLISARLFDVWPAEQAAAILDEECRPALCRHLKPADCQKLLRWHFVDKIDRRKIIEKLQTKHVPKPETWRQLLNLWVYLTPEILSYRTYVKARDIRMVPVQGKDILFAARETVRLGESKLLQSEKDWEFLADYLIVLNQNWPRFLAEQRRNASDEGTPEAEAIQAAYAVLQKIGLGDASDVSKIVDQVAARFFSEGSVLLRECVQLVQIAAKLRAIVGDAFRYATSDRNLRSTKDVVLFDEDGTLSELLPEPLRDSQVLHPDYSTNFSSCTREEWIHWISSERAGLRKFVPLVAKRSYSGRRRGLDEFLRNRGFMSPLESRYKDPWFHVEDWDFDPACWARWEGLAAENPAIWSVLVDRILREKESYWSSYASARIVEVASDGNQRTITRQGVTPSWILRFRDLPCLPDTRGFRRKPDELLRRTPETEALIGVESFVDGNLDREAARPLLDLFGVRSTPIGPDALLNRLRALAKAESPPVHEVEKWYNRLDQMATTCSTGDFQKIRQAFHSEQIILTQQGAWEASPAVFLSTDDQDVPDAEVVRTSVSHLALWSKIGVAERPTADLAIAWLNGLPTDSVLGQEQARRVRSLLARHPVRVWEECGYWLNLAGQWVAVDSLAYALTTQSRTPWQHLHQWVKQKTADLQRLPPEVTGNSALPHLPTLAMCLEEQLNRNTLFTGRDVTKTWLTTLGAELCRIELDTDENTQHVRALAGKLAKTRWREMPVLEIIPYINGTPAGTPRQTDVVWLDDTLLVTPMPKARVARRVPEEVGKVFGRDDIKAALDYGFERSEQDVREYLEENFELCPLNAVSEEPLEDTGAPPSDEQDPLAPVADDKAEDQPGDRGNLEEPSPMLSTENAERDADAAESKQERLRPRRSAKPAKPDIMERFARSKGFRKGDEGRFFHEDGSRIAKSDDDPFPWERRAASGDLVRYYLPKEHCLELEPLQLDFDVWALIEQSPETYALVLSDIKGSPVEITGARLRAMRDRKEITLYPATYRIVYGHG